MSRKRRAVPPTAIEKDFFEALDRLCAGKPANPALKRLAAQGKLRISVSAVAKEARRSRTLIACEDCRYPAVRIRVLEHVRSVSNPRDASAVITRLRADIADLRTKLRNAQAEMAAHFHARQKAERDATRWKDAYERILKKRSSQDPGAQVIPFPRPNE